MFRNECVARLAHLVMAAFFFLPACSQADPDVLEPAPALELIVSRRDDPGFVLIDVRTPEEFRAGHIEGAFLIDYHGADFLERMAGLDRNATVFLYCRSGNRSSKAMQMIRDMGFAKVHDLAGGVIAWTKSGLPLVRANP